MNSTKTLIAAAALAASGLAGAATCKSFTYEVLPLPVAEVYTVPAADITAQAAGVNGSLPGVNVGSLVVYNATSISGCKVTVGYVNAILYVASELRANRCAFEHVLRHERGHVTIYRAALSGVEQRLAERIGKSTSPAVALAEAQGEIDEIRALQARHDSPAEYKTNSTACGGVIPALVGL